HPAGTAPAAFPGFSEDAVISRDGNYVAFDSDVSNLLSGQTITSTNVYLSNRASGAVTLVSHTPASPTTPTQSSAISRRPAATDAGRYVAFLSTAMDLVAGQVDSSNSYDVFLYDRVTGAVTLVSHASTSAATAANGEADHVSLSGDGRYVVF